MDGRILKRALGLQEKWLSWLRDESGAVAVTTGILLVVLLGMVALAIDVGHFLVVRNEVQNAADSASLAGARALYSIQDYPNQALTLVKDPPYCPLAVSTAKAAAGENQASGTLSLTTAPGDVETGIWNWETRSFKPDAGPSMDVNAVWVTVRKDSLANQAVGTWFAQILGIDSVPVKAQAIAAVGYIKEPFGKILPIFIPTYIWDTLPPAFQAKASPDPGDTFAWCAPIPESANASYVKDAINGVPNTPLPGVGDTINLNNGVLGSAHQAVENMIKNAPPTGIIDPTTGAAINGWLTGIMVGNTLNADGSVYSPPPGTPLDVKLNKQAITTVIEPVIVTKVFHDQGGWSLEFQKVDPSKLMVWPGSEPGGPVSQIYATQPKLVR
jgi:hypothetical protein